MPCSPFSARASAGSLVRRANSYKQASTKTTRVTRVVFSCASSPSFHHRPLPRPAFRTRLVPIHHIQSTQVILTDPAQPTLRSELRSTGLIHQSRHRESERRRYHSIRHLYASAVCPKCRAMPHAVRPPTHPLRQHSPAVAPQIEQIAASEPHPPPPLRPRPREPKRHPVTHRRRDKHQHERNRDPKHGPPNPLRADCSLLPATHPSGI